MFYLDLAGYSIDIFNIFAGSLAPDLYNQIGHRYFLIIWFSYKHRHKLRNFNVFTPEKVYKLEKMLLSYITTRYVSLNENKCI